MNQHNQELDII